MQAKRDLRRYAAEAKQAIETLFASDLAELSYVEEPKPAVVNLMTCVRMLWPGMWLLGWLLGWLVGWFLCVVLTPVCSLFLSSSSSSLLLFPPPSSSLLFPLPSSPAGQEPPQPAGADCYRWPRVQRRMRRPHFLPRLRNLADAALAEVLQIPTRRVRAVKVYYNDPDFNTDTFRLIGKGTKAATALHIWLRAVVEAEVSRFVFFGFFGFFGIFVFFDLFIDLLTDKVRFLGTNQNLFAGGTHLWRGLARGRVGTVGQ